MKPENVTEEREMLYYSFDGKEWRMSKKVNFEVTDMIKENLLQELESIRQQIHEGKLSPLAYHIRKHLYGSSFTLRGRATDLNLLASYVEIPKRQVKKHLKPEIFNQLDEEILKKYAEVFEISIEELKNV